MWTGNRQNSLIGTLRLAGNRWFFSGNVVRKHDILDCDHLMPSKDSKGSPQFFGESVILHVSWLDANLSEAFPVSRQQSSRHRTL